jgi:hypothetical protein
VRACLGSEVGILGTLSAPRDLILQAAGDITARTTCTGLSQTLTSSVRQLRIFPFWDYIAVFFWECRLLVRMLSEPRS